MDHAAKHLEAATEAQHAATAPHMGLQIDIPTRSAKGLQVGYRGFAAGYDDQSAIAGDCFARIEELHGDAWFEA